MLLSSFPNRSLRALFRISCRQDEESYKTRVIRVLDLAVPLNIRMFGNTAERRLFFIMGREQAHDERVHPALWCVHRKKLAVTSASVHIAAPQPAGTLARPLIPAAEPPGRNTISWFIASSYCLINGTQGKSNICSRLIRSTFRRPLETERSFVILDFQCVENQFGVRGLWLRTVSTCHPSGKLYPHVVYLLRHEMKIERVDRAWCARRHVFQAR